MGQPPKPTLTGQNKSEHGYGVMVDISVEKQYLSRGILQTSENQEA
jgi:hypothetical protein